MHWWGFALLGGVGGIAVEVLSVLRWLLVWQGARRTSTGRMKQRPPRLRNYLDLPAHAWILGIRGVIGAGTATLFGATGQISGAYVAVALGVAAPTVLTRLGSIPQVAAALGGVVRSWHRRARAVLRRRLRSRRRRPAVGTDRLVRRVVVGLLGVGVAGRSAEPQSLAGQGYSLVRRVLAGLFGVVLPTMPVRGPVYTTAAREFRDIAPSAMLAGPQTDHSKRTVLQPIPWSGPVVGNAGARIGGAAVGAAARSGSRRGGALVAAMAAVLVGGGVVTGVTVFGGEHTTPRPPVTTTAAPTSPNGGPSCTPGIRGNTTIGNGPGDTETGPGAIFGFEYAYYTKRSGISVRTFVAPESPNIQGPNDIQNAIDAVPHGTRYCLAIEPFGSPSPDTDRYRVEIHEYRPDGSTRVYNELMDTIRAGGRTLVYAVVTS
ncbi:hypothetical protein NRB20_38190 [Nocardia sp. RB20]|uniref:DUF8176 domain-containing protein n=1 Tax=Nocardia macrotermitis TaxID=2585198 RepID=A0A7K0D583_9NOCA|nr:hypothetical protein [Nocardia macrotermitis]